MNIYKPCIEKTKILNTVESGLNHSTQVDRVQSNGWHEKGIVRLDIWDGNELAEIIIHAEDKRGKKTNSKQKLLEKSSLDGIGSNTI